MNRCDTRYASRDTQRERERERERHTHKEIDKERDTAHFVSAISFFCPRARQVCVFVDMVKWVGLWVGR